MCNSGLKTAGGSLADQQGIRRTMKFRGFGEGAGRPLRLSDAYCRRHGLPMEAFVDHFLGAVLHPNAKLVYPLVRWMVPDFDKDDRELVLDLGACDSIEEVRCTLGCLPYYYERWKPWRLKLRLRISSRRVMKEISEFQVEFTN
jgi:hypothetical protein